MYPHERSLVQHYQNRPFALIGVNTDDLPDVKRIQQEKNLPWRSFCDGRKGPICADWKVAGFPTIQLIDAHGVVRYSHLGAPPGEVLDGEIETLVKEAEQ
ncbi:MAG TPA: redoxin family protein [Gemmataceae bacterium]|nr:redoxin family protein [Gemmataceae bacterium]